MSDCCNNCGSITLFKGTNGDYVKVTPEPAGPNCTNGGLKVEIISGVDDITVKDTKYVCNGDEISSVTWTSNSGGQPQGTQGTTDTYTITYTDGTTDTFLVYNGADGAPGLNGTDGVDGVYGGWSSEWVFDSNTAVGPGTTEFRFDNASPGSATNLYINKTNADSTNVTAFLTAWTTGSLIRISKIDNANIFWLGTINTVAINFNDVEFGVTTIQANGTFTDTDNFVISYSQIGPQGSPGTPGGGLPWSVLVNPFGGQMQVYPAVNTGTIALQPNAAGIDVFLPGACVIGDIIEFSIDPAGVGNNLQVVAAAGQTISFGDQTTSVAGNLQYFGSNDSKCSMRLLCMEDNLRWTVLSIVMYNGGGMFPPTIN